MADEYQADVAKDAERLARASAHRRATECGRAIQGVLEQYRCRIIPFLQQEPVGADGSAVLTRATYGVIPS